MDDTGIQAELSSLRSSMSALDHKLSDLDRQLGAIVVAVTKLQSGFGKLADELKRNRVIDLARGKRDDLDRELKDTFGRHEEVRKLAANIIHVVSTGVIDDKVILDAAQRRMVDLPDYWLAPATVAVAAWLSREEGKCAEALGLAMRLDRSKTALFMALLLRQHDRSHAMQRWIDLYLSGLQPRNLPADFQVVIDAVAGGALGDGSAPKLADWMSARYLAETRSRDARAEATGEWRQRLGSMATAGEFAPNLAKSCPDWATVRERHQANVVIEAAAGHFRGRFEVGADVPADLTERMRELVTKLARTPDSDEEKMLRDRRLEDAVFRTGDRGEAQRQLAAEDAGRTGSLNILSLVAATAFPASSDGNMPAPTVTELLTIVLSRELIASAVGSLHDCTVRPAEVKVRVGRYQERVCVFSCGTDAEVTREALDAQAAAREADVMAQIRQETDEQQYRLRKFVRRPLPAALSSSAVVAAVPFAVPTGVPAIDFVAPAVTVAAGAVSWLTVLLRRVQTMRSTGAREKIAISKALKAAAAELAKFFAQEQDSTRLHAELQQFLRKLTPDDAYRAVRSIKSPPFPRSRDFPDWTPLPQGVRPGLGPQDGLRPLS
jgi:hypothetical protein